MVLISKNIYISSRKKISWRLMLVLILFSFTLESPRILQASTLSIKTKEIKKSLCGEEFSEKLWGRFSPPLSEYKRLKAEEDLLYLYLLRFQKPDGFNPKQHLSAIELIIKSNRAKEHPNLLFGMLQTILYHSAPLYKKTIDNYPAVLKIKTPVKSEMTACRTDKEIALIKQGVFNYLKYLLHKQKHESILKDWESLIPLSPVLSSLDREKKEGLYDLYKKIYRSIASGAQAHSDGSGLFYSKLQKYTKQPINEIFGRSRVRITDLTFTKGRDGNITPIILGTDPINGDTSTQTDFGFYKKTLPKISINHLQSMDSYAALGFPNEMNIYKKKVKWTHNGKKFNGIINIRQRSKLNYLPSEKEPDYRGFWRDDQLTGVIVVSSNFKKETSDKLITNYKKYYKDAGLTFTSIEVNDAMAFLEEIISSGEADYVIKEAHSQGNEKYLFQLEKTSQIIKGSIKKGNHKGEEVYLIFPNRSHGPFQKLFPRDMETWIKKRSDKNGAELLYLNSSCNSSYIASNEIAAVASPLFSNIPASSFTTVFKHTKEDTKKVILDGLRRGDTYQEIRNKMQKTFKYQPLGYNDFIFPDDNRYSSKYAPSGNNLIDVQINIIDEHGQPYYMDEQF